MSCIILEVRKMFISSMKVFCLTKAFWCIYFLGLQLWTPGPKSDISWYCLNPYFRRGINIFPAPQFSSVAQSFPTLRPHGLQYAKPPCPSPTPGVYSNSCPSSRWYHPTISCSVVPFSFNLSQHQGLFMWVNSSHQVAKGLEFQLQHQSLQWILRTDFF